LLRSFNLKKTLSNLHITPWNMDRRSFFRFYWYCICIFFFYFDRICTCFFLQSILLTVNKDNIIVGEYSMLLVSHSSTLDVEILNRQTLLFLSLGRYLYWWSISSEIIIRWKSKDWKAKYVFGAITPNGLNSIVTVG
jgi:hypothetical protein